MSNLNRKADSLDDAREEISATLSGEAEWIYSANLGRESGSVRRSELEVRVSGRHLIFRCWGDHGARIWRVTNWQRKGSGLSLEVSSPFGKAQGILELIPRASATESATAIADARLERCLALARLVSGYLAGSKVERARLSPGTGAGRPGRYARIVLRLRDERIAVTAVVTESTRPDADLFLAPSLLWFIRIREAVRGPRMRRLMLVVTEQNRDSVLRRVALLATDLREAISVLEINEEFNSLTQIENRELASYFFGQKLRLRIAAQDQISETAASIIGLNPETIDRIRSKHGETLRYNGLPFARLRTLLGEERMWFGLDPQHRRPFTQDSEDGLNRVLEDLRINRAAAQNDRRHALYRLLPEAWLESVLRRDITRLDPGLVISPVHTQFRASGEIVANERPIDLLALREDGRLVVIEIKVSEDLTLPLQGAEYWLRVEAHRRQGTISRARLFGEREIADYPLLVYLVAPALRFHRSFDVLARCIRSEIEMYRFEINEDWRDGVRVTRRMLINSNVRDE